MIFVLVNGRTRAPHPVRCAVNRSKRATYEKSRRSFPTAITIATSVTAKPPSSHSNIVRRHHDNPVASQYLPHVGLSRKRDCRDGTANLWATVYCLLVWTTFKTSTSESLRQRGEIYESGQCWTDRIDPLLL
jgi:hypothetical protein